MKQFLIFLLFSFFCFSSLEAQQNCEQSLALAQELYSSGDYDNCILLIENALKECFFSTRKKEAAYELLTKAYLEQDNLAKAEDNVFKLLKQNPQYEFRETSPNEDFELLVKKFDVRPTLLIGIRTAEMVPSFASTKTFSVLDDVDYTVPYSTNKNVLIFMATAEYVFSKSISANINVIPYSLYFNRSFSKPKGWQMNYHGELSFVELPMYIKKQFTIGKSFSAYAALGGGYLRLTKASGLASISYTMENNFDAGFKDVSLTQHSDVLNQYNQNSYELLGGIGVGYRFKNVFISVDVRYASGLNSVTNSAKRYSNSGFVDDFFYVDNSVVLKKYEVGLSLAYNIKNIIRKVR